MAVDPSLYDTAVRAAQANGVPISLFLSQIQQESSFDPNATNGNAQGIAQFIPSTAEQYGVSNPYDPVTSLWGAAAFDHSLFVQDGGSWANVLRGYGTLPSDPTAPLTSSQTSLLSLAQQLDGGAPLPGMEGGGPLNLGSAGASGGPSLGSIGTLNNNQSLGSQLFSNPLAGISTSIEDYFIRAGTVILGIVCIIAALFMLGHGDKVVAVASEATGIGA